MNKFEIYIKQGGVWQTINATSEVRLPARANLVIRVLN